MDGFFGQFSLRTTNFLGRGETVGVSYQSGRQREFYDLEYRIPWFLDRPQSIGFRLFNQEFDARVLTGVDFEQKYAGASITYYHNNQTGPGLPNMAAGSNPQAIPRSPGWHGCCTDPTARKPKWAATT